MRTGYFNGDGHLMNSATELRGGGFNRRKLTLGMLLLVSLCSITATAAEPARLEAQVPEGAVIYAELNGLDAVVDKVRTSERLTSWTQSEGYRDLLKLPDVQKALAGKALVENQVGMDVWDLGRTLFGGRLALAIYARPGQANPDSVLIVESPDAAKFQQLRQKVEPFLQLAGNKVQRFNVEGIEAVDLDGKSYAATGDKWLIACSTRELLESTLRLRLKSAGPSLASTEWLRQVDAQLGTQHLLRIAANATALKQLAGRRVIPEKSDNVLASLLFGGLSELLAQSSTAGLAVDVADQSLALTLAVNPGTAKLDPAFNVFFGSASGRPAQLPPLPGLIAGFSISRQFAEWYNGREKLLVESLLPEFDKFESGLANLLPNRDFGTDVLPLFGSSLTVVAAPQDFSFLEGRPGVALPGFALIWELKKPEEGEAVSQLLFQTIASVANLTAGQQGRQPWVISSEQYKGISIQLAKYLEKPKGEQLPIVFNFRPAAARVADWYILGSSVDVTKKLIDSLQPAADRAAAPAARDFLLEVRGPALADAVALNQEHLVAQGVREGKSVERSKLDVEFFLNALRGIDSLQLGTQPQGNGYSVRLSASWK